jgi:hypothetical protein
MNGSSAFDILRVHCLVGAKWALRLLAVIELPRDRRPQPSSRSAGVIRATAHATVDSDTGVSVGVALSWPNIFGCLVRV